MPLAHFVRWQGLSGGAFLNGAEIELQAGARDFLPGLRRFQAYGALVFVPLRPSLLASIQRRSRASQFQSGASSVKFPSGNFRSPSRNNFLAGSSLHR
jgi:hypothetical protein